MFKNSRKHLLLVRKVFDAFEITKEELQIVKHMLSFPLSLRLWGLAFSPALVPMKYSIHSSASTGFGSQKILLGAPFKRSDVETNAMSAFSSISFKLSHPVNLTSSSGNA